MDYPLCPWCGHADYHKTVWCEDTCCAGCPDETNGILCDCQHTVKEIEDRNAGIYCYRVMDKEGCAEHGGAAFVAGKRYCERWQDGPAAWRLEDGSNPLVSP